MKNNLFLLLFGSTAIGLITCGLALYFTIIFAMEQDQILDFADDVQSVHSEIEERCSIFKERQALEKCIAELRNTSNFNLLLTSIEPSFEAEEISRVGNKKIYEYVQKENQDEGFQATMPLQLGEVNYWLTVRDGFDHFNDSAEIETNDDLEIALTGAFYGVFILLFILGIFLYLPVRKLNRWIADIQYASEQISKQNYDVRLAQYHTQPLANLASSFNAMAENIQDHIRDKNTLANAIAHELRTPLTRFRLALGLLNRQPLQGLAKELVSDLERYTDDLENITDNTLHLAMLRDSKINFHSIRIDEFIHREGEKFRSSSPQLTILISSQACSFDTDIGFLRLALDNLLSNACQHAKSNVSLTQWQDEKQVHIEVYDDGSGILQKDVEYIQQAFTRLDKSRNRDTGGAGLGLAIVRIAVQRLKGELLFQPTELGTRIRLSLPLNQN